MKRSKYNAQSQPIEGEKVMSEEEFIASKLNEKTGQGITLYEHYLAHDVTVSIGTVLSWMKEYSHPSPAVEKCYPTDEEIRIAGFNHSPTDDRWKGFDEGAKWFRSRLAGSETNKTE